jgi:hypothetical protein
MKTWADTIVGGIMMYNQDITTPEDAVLMGQTCSAPHPKILSKHTHYAHDHWKSGVSIEYPSIAIQDKLGHLLIKSKDFYSTR